MADEVTLTPRDMRLGEEKNIRVVVRDIETNQSLAAATSTIAIYDSNGTTILSETNCTQTGTDRLVCSYFLRSGAGMTITLAGTYRIVWEVTYGGVIRRWQQQLNVYAAPSS